MSDHLYSSQKDALSLSIFPRYTGRPGLFLAVLAMAQSGFPVYYLTCCQQALKRSFEVSQMCSDNTSQHLLFHSARLKLLGRAILEYEDSRLSLGNCRTNVLMLNNKVLEQVVLWKPVLVPSNGYALPKRGPSIDGLQVQARLHIRRCLRKGFQQEHAI